LTNGNSCDTILSVGGGGISWKRFCGS